MIDLRLPDINFELVQRKFKESMSLKSDHLEKIVSVSMNLVKNLCWPPVDTLYVNIITPLFFYD